MTFQEIQNEVVDRTDLSSAKEFARAGRAIQRRYKWVLSSLGLDSVVRSTITANTVIGSREVTFSAEKLFSVFDAAETQPHVLAEVTFDEMRNLSVSTGDLPTTYAIKTMGASTVVITLDQIAESVHALSADAMVSVSALTATGVPAFAADFHDLLIDGAVATIYETQGKLEPADRHEQRFQTRLSELRFFLAKSAYLDIYQGKTAGARSVVV